MKGVDSEESDGEYGDLCRVSVTGSPFLLRSTSKVDH